MIVTVLCLFTESYPVCPLKFTTMDNVEFMRVQMELQPLSVSIVLGVSLSFLFLSCRLTKPFGLLNVSLFNKWTDYCDLIVYLIMLGPLGTSYIWGS